MRLTSIAIALLSVVATASAVTVETRDSANFPSTFLTSHIHRRRITSQCRLREQMPAETLWLLTLRLEVSLQEKRLAELVQEVLQRQLQGK